MLLKKIVSRFFVFRPQNYLFFVSIEPICDLNLINTQGQYFFPKFRKIYNCRIFLSFYIFRRLKLNLHNATTLTADNTQHNDMLFNVILKVGKVSVVVPFLHLRSLRRIFVNENVDNSDQWPVL